MTTFLIFLFYLLAPPRETLVCSLWLSQPPTASQVLAACGSIELANHTVKFINIWSGKTWCEKNATGIYAPDDACHFAEMTLDNFKMDIYRPAQGETIICSIRTYTEQPTRDDIAAECGEAAATLWETGEYYTRLISTIEPTPPALPPTPPPGAGLLDQPAAAADLATADEYHLLARYARAPLEWQNRYDDEIYAAASRWNVPPKLLKRLIVAETQFIPSTGQAGEVGLVQLTEGGIDLMLLYTLPGYPLETPERRAVLRGNVILKLSCEGCTELERAEAARDDFDLYAQALTAYYLCYGSWENALTAWNIKHEEIFK